MSVLRVNKITDISGTGPVEFTKGMSFPSNVSFADASTSATSLGIQINSTTGILSTTDLKASDITLTGICTATLTGNASLGLTNVPGFPTAKAIALTLIT
jgi:hypothetical protein